MSMEQLAAIGRQVTRTLEAHPEIRIAQGRGMTLYVHENFLTDEECDRLISVIDADRVPSGVLTDKPDGDPYFRTSESCNMNAHDPFIAGIDLRISRLLGIDPRYGETIQGQRYAPGQYFRPHQDYFHVTMPYWQAERKRGGQRSWTTMIYLDEAEAGGETNFTSAGLCVSPRKGVLLAWNNMDERGKPNAATLHESVPVQQGQKNIITKWFREAPWG